MPNTIFQIVLPLYALFVVAGLIAQRRHLAKQIGRNPIVIRPFHNTDPSYRYMEGVLLLCALALIVDIALNAISPDTVTQWLSIPAVRQSTVSRWLGLGLMTGGLGLSGAAVRHMGNSWRIGIDREHSESLAVGGLFRRMRHPIYSGILLVV